MRSRRGGFSQTVKFGTANERLRAMNKTLDEIVTKHLEKDELKTLCRLWDVKYTGSPEYDAKALLKIFHGYPNFARDTMAIVALNAASYGSFFGVFGGVSGFAAGGLIGTLTGLGQALGHYTSDIHTKVYQNDKIEATTALLNRVMERIVVEAVEKSPRKSAAKSPRKSAAKSPRKSATKSPRKSATKSGTRTSPTKS